jgi:hypothetical protein
MTWPWRALAILAVFGAAFYLATIKYAFGHGAYTTLRNPVTKAPCCNGEDCAPIAPERVRVAVGGFNVVHESGKITFYPHEQTLQSWDGEYHACFYPNAETLRCLVTPTPGG